MRSGDLEREGERREKGGGWIKEGVEGEQG